MQSVKWNVVERPVLYKDQMFRVELMTDRRNQLLVEVLEMCLGRLQQRLAERLQIMRIKTEFRHLELQQLQQLLNARLQCYRNDSQFVSRQDAS